MAKASRRTDAAWTPDEEVSATEGQAPDGEESWREPVVEMAGGFEILPEEEESRPNPPARGKYPRLLQALLDRGLAPERPAMSIRVPDGEDPLLVTEGLKREGRRVGQGQQVAPDLVMGSWYVEAWVHPKKDRIIQVLAKEGVAPYTKKPKESAGTP